MKENNEAFDIVSFLSPSKMIVPLISAVWDESKISFYVSFFFCLLTWKLQVDIVNNVLFTISLVSVRDVLMENHNVFLLSQTSCVNLIIIKWVIESQD